jgi:hypothetical protein
MFSSYPQRDLCHGSAERYNQQRLKRKKLNFKKKFLQKCSIVKRSLLILGATARDATPDFD